LDFTCHGKTVFAKGTIKKPVVKTKKREKTKENVSTKLPRGTKSNSSQNLKRYKKGDL